ncbi:ABC transporter ATP-binding protein [Vibrio tapetis]|uniref:Uncharacterized ABC transporter ATP-binding protein YclP n=1 Tax=Vibrio tapetis subsp. tapetis TaxID=1671868 RepID=A0A2N8ZK71_9VIBR|nr:ATP-binding cassette domain-containing protein [Vibrio tapetis]SON52311.1 Uncharacterized ABC transporter ATP-binding protein YclP [Vibrio tapetis subsp. tapetis]
MISIQNVSKAFGKQTVVDQASASFVKGEVTAIIGPNGAGKSTLLSLASRLLARDSGEVVIDSKELAEWDTKALAKRLAVLRQSNSLTMRFSIRELVAFGRFPHSNGNLTKQDQVIIDKAISYLDLQDIQHRFLDELSGGQRQLAFIAMVVAQDTDYVFLDEPLNNLDIKHSLQIMKNIRVLAKELNKAVVIVIHDINFASCYSDNIIALKKGVVKVHGTVEEVIRAEVLSSIYDTDFRIEVIDGQRICLYYQ